MNKLQMNNHLLIIALFLIACSEEKVQLISNTPSDLPDQNYKLNLRSPDSGENLESVTITWNEIGGNVTLLIYPQTKLKTYLGAPIPIQDSLLETFVILKSAEARMVLLTPIPFKFLLVLCFR